MTEGCRAGAAEWHERTQLSIPWNERHRWLMSDFDKAAREQAQAATNTRCKWGGGNDYLACRTCGLEYDYRTEERPACGAEATITRLRARVSELEAAQEWRPIESAPRNEKDGGARVSLPIQECPKCGAKAVAFICSRDGCPVNGGAAHRQ